MLLSRMFIFFFFFFSSRRRHTRFDCDWSSDVCSSDLKGGGVKIAKSVDEAGEIASRMLGMKLVTHQTGPEGRIVRRLLIEETLPIEKELYLGIVIDRAEARPVFMASAAGGMEIEQVAAEKPE